MPEDDGVPEGVCEHEGVLEGVSELVGVLEGVSTLVGVLDGVSELVGVFKGVLEGEMSAMTRMSKPQAFAVFWQRTWRKYQAPFCPRP